MSRGSAAPLDGPGATYGGTKPALLILGPSSWARLPSIHRWADDVALAVFSGGLMVTRGVGDRPTSLSGAFHVGVPRARRHGLGGRDRFGPGGSATRSNSRDCWRCPSLAFGGFKVIRRRRTPTRTGTWSACAARSRWSPSRSSASR